MSDLQAEGPVAFLERQGGGIVTPKGRVLTLATIEDLLTELDELRDGRVIVVPPCPTCHGEGYEPVPDEDRSDSDVSWRHSSSHT